MTLKFMILLCLILPINSVLAASAYMFELLIFEYPDSTHEARPTPLTYSDEPDFSLAQGVLHTSGSTAPGIRMVKGKQLSAVAKILNKKGLPVLTHLRWQQRVKGRKNNQWLQIDEGPLRGLVHVERGRFLHFTADLLFQGIDQTYRVPLQRRMKSGDTHYLDHPKIGVIVRAEPIHRKTKPGPTKPITTPTPTAPTQPTKPKDDRPSALPDLS